jgi:hypothetical protein
VPGAVLVSTTHKHEGVTSMIEAKCLRCGNHFNPLPPQGPSRYSLVSVDGVNVDVEHFATDDGTECGGRGEIVGVYKQSKVSGRPHSRIADNQPRSSRGHWYDPDEDD